MSQEDFYKLFLHELSDLYSAEQQIVQELPNLIKAATSEDLKEALKNHLEETKIQVDRLNQIFNLLQIKPSKKVCAGIKGILHEGSDFISEWPKSAVRDAAIIAAAQKVEHYEITSYGSAYSHADFLNLDKEIKKLLDDTLDEEKSANKKLNKLAEGTTFSSGINKLACAR
jgi:ferritin-like metal-binding protein YciE